MSLNLLFSNLISVLIFFILYKNKNFITKKFNLIDHPDNNRKLHQTKTPLIGGLLIFVCVVYLIAVDQLFIINTNFIAKIIAILFFYSGLRPYICVIKLKTNHYVHTRLRLLHKIISNS